MGRPAIPLKVHESQGTRGVARIPSEAIRTGGRIPPKPRGLDVHGRFMWDLVVRHRGEWLAESDGPAMQSMCEVWSLRCRAYLAVKADVTDKLARTAFTQYQFTFERLAAKFGLSPSDRARLGEVDPDKFDPAAEFVR